MNFTFNYTESTLTQNDLVVKEILTDVCNQWEGKTLLSHILYVKVFLIIFLIYIISLFWNPYINYKYKVKLFNKEFYLIDQEFYLLDHIKMLLIVFVIAKIFDAFIIQFIYINGMSYIEILKMLIMG